MRNAISASQKLLIVSIAAAQLTSAEESTLFRTKVLGWKDQGSVHALEASFLLAPALRGDHSPWRRIVGVFDPDSRVGWVYRAFAQKPMGREDLTATLGLHFVCNESTIVAFRFSVPGSTMEMAASTARYPSRALFDEAILAASQLPPTVYHRPNEPLDEVRLPQPKETRFFTDRLPNEFHHDLNPPDAAKLTSARIERNLVYFVLTKPVSRRAIEVSFDWRKKRAGPQRRLSAQTAKRTAPK